MLSVMGKLTLQLSASLAALALCSGHASAQTAQKPNILFIVSDDTGYGDLGPYGGGEGRGMPTPNIDQLADEGMTFFSFYAQPSCTPGRAAMQTGRIPNRSGMTTVAFQGQGGGLPAAEWTLASVLKTGRLPDLLHRQMAPGRGRLRAAQRPGLRRDEVRRPLSPQRLHLCRPDLVPRHGPGSCGPCSRRSPRARSPARPARTGRGRFKINGQYVNTPVIDGKEGVVGIPFFDSYVEKAAIDFLDEAAKTPNKPFFINVNFMKVHQPNMPAPEFQQKSMSKSSTPTPSSNSTPASAASWTSSAPPGWIRIPWSSTPPTTAPGRTSILTPATPRSAAPRAPCARAATAFPPSRSGRARSSRHPRTTTSSAAST